MTLDEAIKHCEEKAKELYCKADEDYFFDGDWGKKLHCTECAEEHEQLAEWLKELKALRGDNKSLCDTCRYMFNCEYSDIGVSSANHSVCQGYVPIKNEESGTEE